MNWRQRLSEAPGEIIAQKATSDLPKLPKGGYGSFGSDPVAHSENVANGSVRCGAKTLCKGQT